MQKQFWLGAAFSLLTCIAASAAEWTVTCGDNFYCIARIDLTEAKGGSGKFKIERSNVADGKVYVTYGPSEALAIGMPVRIETLSTGFSHEGPIDKVYGGNEMTFTETARGPIVEALRGAASAQISVRFGGSIGTTIQDISLSGLTAALLEIDSKQGRIGRSDALVAWGSIATDQAAAASPAIAEQPLQPTAKVQPQVTAQTPAAVTESAEDEAPIGSGSILYAIADLPPAVADFAPNFGCDLNETLQAWGGKAMGMGEGSVLYLVPCQNGDVNIEHYVSRVIGGAAKLFQFDTIPGDEPAFQPTLINPIFDATTGLLTAVAYDSPDSDCGRYEQHRYLKEQDSFELIAVRIKSNCDGTTTSPEEWPVEWTIDEMGG